MRALTKATLVGLLAFLPLGAWPQTFEVLHDFALDLSDAVNPYAGLTQASGGNFYGTSSLGGVVNSGAVFTMRDEVVTLLYSFSFWGSDQAYPQAGLLQARDGNLYGTTCGQGNNIDHVGTVFRISTDGTLTTLYSFSTNAPDGQEPEAGLIQCADGCLYGTASSGGSNGFGMVFRMTTNGNCTQMYAFGGSQDGSMPLAGLLHGADGYLYGTASQGGSYSWGTVFRLSTNGQYTTMHTFSGGSQPTVDGAFPAASLIQGRDGNLYGTTEYGGSNFKGAVFRLSTGKAYTTIHSFAGTDGAYPAASLIQASDGNLYGTTTEGGTNGQGTIFRVSTNGAFSSLYSFTGGLDGATPLAGVIQAKDGNLYGTTEAAGGVSDAGSIFRLDLVAPTIRLGVVSSSGGELVLIATGLTTLGPVVLLASTDLSTWQPILTNTPAGTVTFPAVSMAGQPRCFFRVRQQQ